MASSRANATIAFARAAMMPVAATSDGSSAAMRAGVGKRCVSAACGVSIGSPSFATKRPAIDRGGLHRHLLAEDRAHRDLEAVERAGQAHAGVRCGERAEARGDIVGMAGEVEERA